MRVGWTFLSESLSIDLFFTVEGQIIRHFFNALILFFAFENWEIKKLSKHHALTSLYKRREEATRWTNNKLMTMTTWESFKVSTLFDYNLFTHTFDVRDSLISNQWERKFAYWEFFFTSKMMTNFCAIKFFLFQAMMHEAGLLLCEIIRSFRLYKKSSWFSSFCAASLLTRYIVKRSQ